MVDVTPLTVGRIPSIIISLLEDKELGCCGLGSVKVALFPATSLIVPPFNGSAVDV